MPHAASPGSREAVAVFRRFNRFYTRLLGLFNRKLLGGPLTLTEARALFEIASEPGVTATALSDKLGLDRGQLSRVTSRLLGEELIRRSGNPGGRRSLPLSPTARGLALMDDIEALANSQASALMAHLDAYGRAHLAKALMEVMALLGRCQEPASGRVALREAASPDLGWIIARHAELYALECGFGDDFAHYVLLGLAEYVQKDPAGSRVWMAEMDGAPMGAVGLVHLGDGRAQLRWLLVEPAARGLGLGRRLVERALAFARERGYRQVILWTITSLAAARSLYDSCGFTPAGQKPGVMGGVPVTEELWTLSLNRERR